MRVVIVKSQRTATHCNTLQHTAPHCNNILKKQWQEDAGCNCKKSAHCNTLQQLHDTATNILQRQCTSRITMHTLSHFKWHFRILFPSLKLTARRSLFTQTWQSVCAFVCLCVCVCGLKLKARRSLFTQHFSLFSLKRGKWDVSLKRSKRGVKLKARVSLQGDEDV